MTLSNNQDANSGLGGGGIQITGGNLTITNSLIGGTSPPCTAASPTCASGTDRNNVNLANSAQTSGGGVNYTPSSPMHTGGTGTLTVTGTTITRNTASGIGGGGFDLYIFAFALPGGIGSGSANISTSTISNNQATGGKRRWDRRREPADDGRLEHGHVELGRRTPAGGSTSAAAA